MLRKESEAVPEGNGPVPQKEEFGSGQPTWRDVYRRMKEAFDRWDRKLDKISDRMEKCIEERTSIDQRLTRLEHGGRQPRLAMEADGHANTKTQGCTEGAAKAVQAMRRDSCTTAHRVQDGPMTNSTSFGVMAEPPDLPCREDVLVEEGATSPEWCLPFLEMRLPTVAGGIIPTGKASTATRTTSNEPLLRFYATEEMNPEEDSKKKNLWTPTPYTSYDSSVFQESNLSAVPYCRRIVEIKSRQNRTFGPGGSQGHLRVCPF